MDDNSAAEDMLRTCSYPILLPGLRGTATEYLGTAHIGCRIATNKNGEHVIVKVKEGQSASFAGILEGSIIRAVDGFDVHDVPKDTVKDLITGPKGSFVALALQPPGTHHSYIEDVVLMRGDTLEFRTALNRNIEDYNNEWRANVHTQVDGWDRWVISWNTFVDNLFKDISHDSQTPLINDKGTHTGAAHAQGPGAFTVNAQPAARPLKDDGGKHNNAVSTPGPSGGPNMGRQHMDPASTTPSRPATIDNFRDSVISFFDWNFIVPA